MTSLFELMKAETGIGELLVEAGHEGLLEKPCNRRNCNGTMSLRTTDLSPHAWLMKGKGEVKTLMGSFECPKCRTRRRVAISSVRL